MTTEQREPKYVFDEVVACRLRNLAYNFAAAIDELLARTRIDPIDSGDVGFEELGFWEAKSELLSRLPQDSDIF